MLHVQWVRCNHLDIRAHVHLIWPLLTEIRSCTHKTGQWFVLIAKYNNGSDSSSTIGIVLQSISSDFGKRPAESCARKDLGWLELVSVIGSQVSSVDLLWISMDSRIMSLSLFEINSFAPCLLFVIIFNANWTDLDFSASNRESTSN